MKKSVLNSPLISMAAVAGAMGIKIPTAALARAAGQLPAQIRTNPKASRGHRSISLRPPVGWRKAVSLRRYKKIMARRRANSRRAA